MDEYFPDKLPTVPILIGSSLKQLVKDMNKVTRIIPFFIDFLSIGDNNIDFISVPSVFCNEARVFYPDACGGVIHQYYFDDNTIIASSSTISIFAFSMLMIRY